MLTARMPLQTYYGMILKNEDADNIVVDVSAYVDYYLMSRLFEDIKGRGANIDDERLQLRVA